MKNRDEKMRQRYLERELERLELMNYKRDIEVKTGEREISDKDRFEAEAFARLMKLAERIENEKDS